MDGRAYHHRERKRERERGVACMNNKALKVRFVDLSGWMCIHRHRPWSKSRGSLPDAFIFEVDGHNDMDIEGGER